MPSFHVTLHFTVERNFSDDEVEYESNRTSKQRQKDAFDRTDAYYDEYSIVESIKDTDAFSMVEFSVRDGTVMSAEWDRSLFAIHMVIETSQTLDELRDDLQTNPLEDTEYEACGETSWILFTRDDEGNPYEGGEGSNDVWEYARVDYRQDLIDIQQVA